MTGPISQTGAQLPNPERYKTLVVILTVLTTVVTAIIAGLQADANIRSSSSNRDSQVYAIQAASELNYQDLQFAYNMNVFAGYLKDGLEATVLQMTALQQEQSDPKAAADSKLRALVAQARADQAQKFSIFFNDPRYAPKKAGGMPDLQSYLTDMYATAKSLVVQQNAAADDYNRWNRKGDAYTSILAILAVAFFLFGLAQALSPRLRLVFALFGVVAVAAAGLGTLLTLVT